MAAQGNNYLSKNLDINKNRYINSTNRLGDRTITSNTVDGKRYYSSLDAEIYFGETYIDEIVRISWAVEQATMPLFGYNSYTFDDLAVGARQVSGSFIVNFTKSGFMYDVLRSLQAVNRSSLNVSEELNDPVNLNWSSNFEKEHKASWDRSFNIRVGYGDHTKGGAHTTMTVIHCVQITGCQQELGLDGAPIAEVYSFIAKDIRYELLASTPNSDTRNADNSNENEFIDKEEFVIVITPEKITKPNGKEKYEIKVTHKAEGGKVRDIKLTLKDHNNKKINNASISIGKDVDSTIEIPPEHTKKINDIFTLQKKEGIKNPYLNCDFQIIYTKNDMEKAPIYSNNKKVYLA